MRGQPVLAGWLLNTLILLLVNGVVAIMSSEVRLVFGGETSVKHVYPILFGVNFVSISLILVAFAFLRAHPLP